MGGVVAIPGFATAFGGDAGDVSQRQGDGSAREQYGGGPLQKWCAGTSLCRSAREEYIRFCSGGAEYRRVRTQRIGETDKISSGGGGDQGEADKQGKPAQERVAEWRTGSEVAVALDAVNYPISGQPRAIWMSYRPNPKN